MVKRSEMAKTKSVRNLTVLDIALLNKLLISTLIVTNITYWPV